MKLRVTTKGISQGPQITENLAHADFITKDPRDQIKALGNIILKSTINEDECKRIIDGLKILFRYGSGQTTLNLDQVMSLSREELEGFGKISKRKILIVRLKIKIGEYFDNMQEEEKQDLLESGIDKETFINKQIRWIWDSFKGMDDDIITTLQHEYGLTSEIAFFLKEFMGQNDFSSDLGMLLDDQGIPVQALIGIADSIPYGGMKTAKIKKDTSFEIHDGSSIMGNYLSPESEHEKEIADARNGFINPNWFLSDIDVSTAVKLWGIKKSQYIFGKYFRESIANSEVGEDLSLPDFYNLGIFRLKIDADNEGNKQKFIDMGQHIFEWEIDEDFSAQDFATLGQGLKSVLPDLKHSGVIKNFKHPVQTRPGVKKYNGFFSGTQGFENTHIIDIQPEDKKGKRVLRFASEVGQDELLFITIQISYFIKHKKLIEDQKLWREIYKMYNALSLEGVEIFPSSTMKEQYDTLVKKVIWPLSSEHKEKKGNIGKAHNTVLYGVYGTGKSQLLTHLISERVYSLKNGENIHLEAVVINISVTEFADLLLKSSSEFRKRLSDIHENTGLPIILVIEDVDTIIKEQGVDSDPISQAMTTIFDGVGSLPITVITSSNNPEKIPQRHLRPNRFDTPIGFEYPMNKETLGNILRIHWKKKGLDSLLDGYFSIEEIQDFLLNKITNFTPSHISAFCLSILEDLEFEDLESLGTEEIKQIILKSLESILVPVKDMQEREKSMKKWREELGSQGFKIGF